MNAPAPHVAHDAQETLEVVVHADETYCPAEQVLHSAQALELATVEKLIPAWQDPHTALADAEQLTEKNDPAAHPEHACG